MKPPDTFHWTELTATQRLVVMALVSVSVRFYMLSDEEQEGVLAVVAQSKPPTKADTVHWNDLTDPQRRLVMALIRVAEASKAAKELGMNS